MMKKYFIAFSFLSGVFFFAQTGNVGINTSTPDTNAVLDVVSTHRGILNPRVALTAISSPSPLTAHVAGMVVYNTATTGDVVPALYYNDGTQWVKTADGVGMEPWYDQATNTEATANTQNIYQMGSVAIGKNAALAGASLDVLGAVRMGGAGGAHLGTVGVNSVIIGGILNTATGLRSAAGGFQAQATGTNSLAFGLQTSASGANSTAFGFQSSASGTQSFVAGGLQNSAVGSNSFATGSQASASGNNSFAAGAALTASSLGEFVIGRFNAITTGDATAAVATDAAFQIGNGTGVSARSNALTVLKNGNTGIGAGAIAPHSTLQVTGSFAAPIRTGSGTLTIADYTILGNGDITLPDPTTFNGRVYHILYDGVDFTINGLLRGNGADFTTYGMNSGNPQKRLTVQSNGIRWVILF